MRALDQISSVLEPYITEVTIHAEIYLNGCLKNHLLYLINKHRSGDKILFCPDLAPSHYTQTVIYSLEAETIKVVPKTKNPSNFLEARPINKFWVICKQKYAE